MKAFQGEAERVYVVTLSAELSGSYNSAVLGKNLFLEEYGEKDIYVFNSRSASVGETMIAKKIMECEEQGMTFQEVIDAVETYIDGQNTYFVLESLETLRKNGRLTGLKALAASVLNIKPLLQYFDGELGPTELCRGRKKSLCKVAEMFVAFQLEHTYTKDEILELYVNSIYFGDGYYGIGDACKGYLNKAPIEMTNYECTLMAGIPNAPSVYSLTENPALAEQRQKYVVRQMVKYGYITEDQAQSVFK